LYSGRGGAEIYFKQDTLQTGEARELEFLYGWRRGTCRCSDFAAFGYLLSRLAPNLVQTHKGPSCGAIFLIEGGDNQRGASLI